MTTELTSILLDQIDADVNNPRTVFDEGALDELAGSIRIYGVLQPILVTKNNDSDRYKLVAGERRWRAARLAGYQSIPALVVDFQDADIREIQVVENLDREQLNLIDEALAFHDLKQQYSFTDAELARRFRKSVGDRRRTRLNS